MPKKARKKLGLKKRDKLNAEVDEKKTIILQSSLGPPSSVFVRAGSKLTSSILKEADEIDEIKIKKLLGAV